MTSQNEEVQIQILFHSNWYPWSSFVSYFSFCVYYIFVLPFGSVRVQAEELMRKIEKEEEQISYDDPDKKIFHLCIVNLVIGYVQYF